MANSQKRVRGILPSPSEAAGYFGAGKPKSDVSLRIAVPQNWMVRSSPSLQEQALPDTMHTLLSKPVAAVRNLAFASTAFPFSYLIATGAS